MSIPYMTSYRNWPSVARCVYGAALLISLASVHVRCTPQITRLSVPSWVRNGTEEGVVLDCEYTYNQNDVKLVIKWFFNDEMEAVYQWIPQLNLRTVSGVLSGRLDMDYTVPDSDAYTQYRALKIIRPTTELSGKYTCLIMSLAGQDLRHKEMTVYAPAQKFHFEYTIINDVVNFTCTATNLYPEPQMKIFYFPDGKRRKVFGGESRTVVKNNNASFDITHWTTPNSRELSEDRVTEVECNVDVFGSPYKQTERITYVPGVPGSQVFYSRNSEAASRPVSQLWILVPLAILTRSSVSQTIVHRR